MSIKLKLILVYSVRKEYKVLKITLGSGAYGDRKDNGKVFHHNSREHEIILTKDFFFSICEINELQRDFQREIILLSRFRLKL